MKHNGRFARLPRELIDSSKFRKLDSDAVKLLWYLCSLFYPTRNGTNNGILTVTTADYERWGFSEHRYKKAMGELEKAYLIFRTNSTGEKDRDVFALTWLPVKKPLPVGLSVSRMKTVRYKHSPFARIPADVINTRKFADMAGNAIKLLTYMLSDWRQSKGIRAKGYTLNGYLQCSYELESTPKAEKQTFKNRGFTEYLWRKARNELLEAGFIVRTYEGKPHRPKDKRSPVGKICDYSYDKGLTVIREQVLPDLYAFTWGEYHIIPSDEAVLMDSLRFRAPPSEMLSDNPLAFPVDAWMDGVKVKQEQEPSTVE